MDQTILKAQIKGKFENLTANYVPIFFEGPSKKVKSKTLTAKYGPKIFEGPSKREIQKLNCQLWTKKKLRPK